MSKGLFFVPDDPEKQLEFTREVPIDKQITDLEVGGEVSFPISKKGSVTGRVSDLNRKFAGEKIWHTKTMKLNFTILVIRDK